METEFLFISMAGVPNILSDFVPDNGLASLASSLMEEGVKVKILDLNRVSLFSEIFSDEEKKFLEKFSRKVFIEEKKVSFADICKLKFINRRIEKNKKLYLERLKSFINNIVQSEKVKAVGFKLWAGDGFLWSMEVGKYLKSKNPEIKIFGGGPQVDIFEHLIYKEGDFFDALCYGEGEETIKELYKFVQGSKKLDDIPNLIFKKNGKIIKTDRKLIENLDSLSIPVYEKEIYLKIEEKIQIIVIDESRGCPNSCFFCIHPKKSGKRREKSIDRIVSEINLFRKKYGVRLFRYAGSSTPGKLMMDVAKRLIEENIKISYTSFGHVKEFDVDFEILKKSGCEAIFFGVESANEEILQKGMNKKIKKEEMKEVLKKCREAGIFTVISLIYPAPFETDKTRQETINFVKEVKPDSVLVQFPGIYPGTMWFKHPEKFNFHLDKEKYPYQVMNYKISSLFPPRYWLPLPYTVNGLPFRKFAYETEMFQKDLKKEGIETSISDEAYLFYRNSPFNSLEEFLKFNRYYFYSGNEKKLIEEINYINEKSKGE